MGTINQLIDHWGVAPCIAGSRSLIFPLNKECLGTHPKPRSSPICHMSMCNFLGSSMSSRFAIFKLSSAHHFLHHQVANFAQLTAVSMLETAIAQCFSYGCLWHIVYRYMSMKNICGNIWSIIKIYIYIKKYIYIYTYHIHNI